MQRFQITDHTEDVFMVGNRIFEFYNDDIIEYIEFYDNLGADKYLIDTNNYERVGPLQIPPGTRTYLCKF